MAKRIIRPPGRKRPIKNAHLIGAGNSFKAVKDPAGKTLYAPSILKQRGQSPTQPVAKSPRAMRPVFKASMKARVVDNKQVTPTQRSVRLPKANGVSSAVLKGEVLSRPKPRISRGPKR